METPTTPVKAVPTPVDSFDVGIYQVVQHSDILTFLGKEIGDDVQLELEGSDFTFGSDNTNTLVCRDAYLDFLGSCAKVPLELLNTITAKIPGGCVVEL